MLSFGLYVVGILLQYVAVHAEKGPYQTLESSYDFIGQVSYCGSTHGDFVEVEQVKHDDMVVAFTFHVGNHSIVGVGLTYSRGDHVLVGREGISKKELKLNVGEKIQRVTLYEAEVENQDSHRVGSITMWTTHGRKTEVTAKGYRGPGITQSGGSGLVMGVYAYTAKSGTSSLVGLGFLMLSQISSCTLSRLNYHNLSIKDNPWKEYKVEDDQRRADTRQWTLNAVGFPRVSVKGRVPSVVLDQQNRFTLYFVDEHLEPTPAASISRPGNSGRGGKDVEDWVFDHARKLWAWGNATQADQLRTIESHYEATIDCNVDKIGKSVSFLTEGTYYGEYYGTWPDSRPLS